MTDRWPSLPYESWKDTQATLHRFAQLVGKIALHSTPLVNHFWNCSLRPVARGLRTLPLPKADGTTFDLTLDLVAHVLSVRTSEGPSRDVAMTDCTVAAFCSNAIAELADLGIHVDIDDRPVEIPSEAIPLLQDHKHSTYDPEKAHAWLQIVLSSTEVMRKFRAGFVGKCSPIQFWWGAFDLAVTRFSGRRAPPREGPFFQREAYSHECSSVGVWPGADDIGGPFYYAYTVPGPAGLERAAVEPAAASWNPQLGEHLLSYEAVRTAKDPEAALLAFCRSTYEAGASLGKWDRAALER